MKITIGVPTYNQRKSYFIECLESIKNQTCNPQIFEVIILDDGSDNREEVEKITKEFGFKYIYQKNAGVGSARQSIVDNASEETEYIAFLSSDDIWEPNFLEVMIRESEKHPGKILYSKYYAINENSEIVGDANVSGFDNHEDFCIACLDKAYKNNMFTNFSCVFIPKRVFNKIKFKYEFGEDLYFLLTSMKHFKYHLVPEYLLKYRIVDNLTSKIRHKIAENNEKIIKDVLEFWKDE